MLMHAERACVELEEARLRLRAAIDKEVRDRCQQRAGTTASLESASAPLRGAPLFN
jgi:hypothetical protein